MVVVSLPGFSGALPRHLLRGLQFQCPKKALDRGVFPAVRLAAHAKLDFMALGELLDLGNCIVPPSECRPPLRPACRVKWSTDDRERRPRKCAALDCQAGLKGGLHSEGGTILLCKEC